MNHIVVFREAQDEAKHLSKGTGRSVEVAPKDCDCSYSPLCLKCERGTQYTLVYSFCSHLVNEDGEDTEICIQNYCREQEIAKSEFDSRDSFARVAQPLRSCRERTSEQAELEVA